MNILKALRTGLAALLLSTAPAIADESAEEIFQTVQIDLIQDCLSSNPTPFLVQFHCRAADLPEVPIWLKTGDARWNASFGSYVLHGRSGRQGFADPQEIDLAITFFGRPGAPHIALQRWDIHPGEDFARTVPVYVISTVSSRQSCHVALVDATANPDAQTLARTFMADADPDISCPDPVPWLGKVSEAVSGLHLSWPD